jgi:hypothetical protein
MIAAARAVIRRPAGRRCVYAAGVVYGLYVVIGNALRPGATAVTVIPVVGVVCSIGTVVIVAASTAESYWRNRRARS